MMNLVFYLAKFGNWEDKLISVVTHSRFSHVELQFSDGAVFTSTFSTGTGFESIDLTQPCWVVVPLPVQPSAEVEAKIREWCVTQVGCQYDLLAVLCIDLPGNIHSRGKWYCSEVCAAALRENGVWHYPENLSPGFMYNLTMKWKETVEAGIEPAKS